jgi:hypothetical protein
LGDLRKNGVSCFNVAPLFEMWRATPDKFKIFQPAEQIHPDTARKPDFFMPVADPGKTIANPKTTLKNHIQ